MAGLDYRQWMQQPLIWTERMRSRALVWTPDAHWFINDPLGQLAHSHDDASEILYMAAGQLDIQIGPARQRVGPGDLLMLSPGTFHNYWFAGDETACLFVVVTPNHKNARWRYKDFPPEAYRRTGQIANVFRDELMPSDERITTRVATLAPGEAADGAPETQREKVLYVLQGRAAIQVGRLHGELGPDEYQHIPVTTPHRMANAGAEPLRYFEFVCFDPTAPAPIRPEDAHLAQED
jgi:mannose-6-phosphate isomerase-like protein (cupin superfamily)